MAINNIKINLDFKKELQKILKSNIYLNKIGNTLDKEVKDFVSKGISPIKNLGRFKGYKVDRTGQSGNKSYYPNSVKKDFPTKKKRPVNLSLSGAYLKKLTYKIRGSKLAYGFFGLTKKQFAMFETHNKGRLEPDIPKRQVIPNTSKETFNVSITNALIKTINSILKKEIKKR